jgi:transcriptional regulator with XRE-family HTH domain
MTTANKREEIWESLKESDYRHQFVEEEINVGIAFQIRSLRNRQKLSQVNMAKRMKIKQPLLSAWENPNYGKYTLGTLKDLAKAFDVGLLVRFVPFSELVNRTMNLTSDVIAPPSFREEQNAVTSGMFYRFAEIKNTGNVDANKSLSSLVISQINDTQAGDGSFLNISKKEAELAA